MDNLLEAAERFLVVALFSALVGLIVFNVVTRNLFQVSFQEPLEWAPALVLWLALLGSTLALKSGRHIRLELLLRFCPPRLQRLASAITGSFGALVMGVLFYASIGFVQNELAIFGRIAWLSIIFPLFFALSGFRFAAQAIMGQGAPEDTSGRPFGDHRDHGRAAR